jgi:hypothetical protein
MAGFNLTDASGTITTGGTAQLLFAGAIPVNGFYISNPDAANDLWWSVTGIAAPNAAGSDRIQANGGFYETPPGVSLESPISIYGAVTGQKFTAWKW